MKLSIGELERLTGMNRTALRFYDAEGLITPQRLENGYRVYSEQDLLSLVQLKQLNALGVGLAELPSARNRIGCADVCSSLSAQIESVGQEIEDLYQKLSRLRLHVDAFRHCADGDREITESRMPGVYRLYLNNPGVDPARTAEIVRRWMCGVPETYSAIRIRQDAMRLGPQETCGADTGLGLLSTAFRRLNETCEPPVEYTPPCKCIQGMIETASLSAIPAAALIPFARYLQAHDLIPLGDFYGWVVYTPAHLPEDTFKISLRIGIH